MKIILATLIGTIHILAVAGFLGGAFLMNVAVQRAGQQLDPPSAGKLNMITGQIYSIIAWVSIIVLLLTGLLRSAVIGAFTPKILFGSIYGNILLVKILLVLIIIAVGITITRTGMTIMKLQDSGSAPDQMKALGSRIVSLTWVNFYIGVIVVILAVALRMIGLPE